MFSQHLLCVGFLYVSECLQLGLFTQSDLQLYAAQGQGHGVDWSIKHAYTEPYTRAVDKGLFTTSCPDLYSRVQWTGGGDKAAESHV